VLPESKKRWASRAAIAPARSPASRAPGVRATASRTHLPISLGTCAQRWPHGSHAAAMVDKFWFALLWFALALGIIVASAWPVVAAAIRSAATPGVLSIDWGALFATIGGATAGALGIVAVWAWVIYRLIRGGLRLQDARPVP
jgi:uncharacterized membrane protein